MTEIWTEKYKPKTLHDLVLPESLKDEIRYNIDKNVSFNYLFASKHPGLGKSSLASIIINETEQEAKWINGSLENGIDILRNKIASFVSTASFDNMNKIVVIDEADYLSPNSTQPAFRGFIDEFSKTTSFIFTCNYKEKIIKPLRSRLVTIDFDYHFNNNKPELLKEIYKKCLNILEEENIKFDHNDVKSVIKELYPSVREILLYLQTHIIDNELNLNHIKNENINNFYSLIKAIERHDYINIRKIATNIPNSDEFYSYFFTFIDKFIEYDDIPKVTLLLGLYAYRDAFIIDKTLSLSAFAADFMQKNIKFRSNF